MTMTTIRSINTYNFLILFLGLGLFVALAQPLKASANKNINPYEILGVEREATLKEIAQAFKRKTLDAGQQWFKNLGHEKGVQLMKDVSRAFEILSEPACRKKYDETGKAEVSSLLTQGTDEEKGEASTVWKKKSIFNQNFRRMGTQILKDRPEVQMSQARLVHITLLEQLEALVMDDNKNFERNLLLCFVKPGDARNLADDVILFPHPYAGGFSRFGLWWEDLIQSLEVVVPGPNELTHAFGIDDVVATTEDPIFVFMRRGGNFMNETKHHTATKQTEFEDWVMESLNDIQVEVQFVNNHDHPVELVFIEGKFQKVLGTIPAGETHIQASYLFHEFAVRDARVDKYEGAPNTTKLTLESCLDSWLLDLDRSPLTLVIERVACYDLSGACGMWYNGGYCNQENENYTMAEIYCRQTCAMCNRNDPIPLEPEL